MSVSWKHYQTAFEEKMLAFGCLIGPFSDFDLFSLFFSTPNIAQLYSWVLHPTQNKHFGRVVKHLREVPAPFVTSVRGMHLREAPRLVLASSQTI